MSKPTVAAHHWSFHHLPIDEACTHAKKLGYDGLDLAIGDQGSGVRLDLGHLASDRREAERIAEVGERSGIQFTDLVGAVIHMPGMSPSDRDTAFETFARFAGHGRALGINGVTAIPGFYDTSYDEAFDLVASELRRYVTASADGDMALSIEPHVESVTDTPERTLAMLEAVPGLTLTLDYSHFIHQGFTQSEIAVLDRFARHVHARQATTGRLSVPVDKGTIDYVQLADHLRSLNYQGAFTTEYVDSEWYDQNTVDVPRENERMRTVLIDTINEVWR